PARTLCAPPPPESNRPPHPYHGSAAKRRASPRSRRSLGTVDGEVMGPVLLAGDPAGVRWDDLDLDNGVCRFNRRALCVRPVVASRPPGLNGRDERAGVCPLVGRSGGARQGGVW